jgi:tricorn protease
MGFRGSFSPDGKRIVVDRVDRWDVEFRSYRGGQNTPLTITDVSTGAETRLPNERTMDIDPVWVGETIYFLSDRDWATKVWSFDTRSSELRQLTRVRDADVKTLDARGNALVYEQDGYLWMMEPIGSAPKKLAITSPAISRPRRNGPTSPAASRPPRSGWQEARCSRREADLHGARRGRRVTSLIIRRGGPRRYGRRMASAWHGSPTKAQAIGSYQQRGWTGAPRAIAIGDAKMVVAAWSPDASHIAVVDSKVRRGSNIASGTITVADTGGGSTDLNAMEPAWSPDSKWIAYAKSYPNQFRRVLVWSLADGRKRVLTDALASAGEPAWDANGRWLYFLASTDLGVQSGWADLGSQTRTSTSGVYVALLRADEPTPFTPESDEERADAADSCSGDAGLQHQLHLPVAPIHAGHLTIRPHGRRRGLAIGGSHRFRALDRRILSAAHAGGRLRAADPRAHWHSVAPSVCRISRGWCCTSGDDPAQGIGLSGVARLGIARWQEAEWQQGVGPNAAGSLGDGRAAQSRRGHGPRGAQRADRPRARVKQIRRGVADGARLLLRPEPPRRRLDAVRTRYQPLVPYVRHRTDLTYILTCPAASSVGIRSWVVAQPAGGTARASALPRIS